MSETQSAPAGAGRLKQELAAAAIFLTRLPVRFDGIMPPDLHGRAIGWYPVIGALVGLCGALAYAAASTAGLTAASAALLALCIQIAMTGALHEDGLADVADGFGGGRDKMAKLAIMRDSRLGSYGVLVLIFSVGLRWSALVALADPLAVGLALVSAGALSRAAVPAVYGWLDPARGDGLAAGLGGPPGTRVVMAAVLGGCIAGVLLAGFALPVTAVAILAALAVGGLALRQIGGHTGDVLGACQQAVEIAVLLTLVMLPWNP
ncbi:adenosylcobinamide-GDP ribazoletransferase [Skermanella aerolata]|uniref:Adenosylcobinamide-GDP ribazoletransferase n=3 Tax=Skermanella aerolata TaxID=393310 RepID=A0A512DQ56_9PROT|nr:adenosylcobinamide-GDP ribazoletransferase [Skermanella aerolata]GEO38621.1 adenosylcobinamide-GDP ribazoletransferase [Skermanella aerolata]